MKNISIKLFFLYGTIFYMIYITVCEYLPGGRRGNEDGGSSNKPAAPKADKDDGKPVNKDKEPKKPSDDANKASRDAKPDMSNPAVMPPLLNQSALRSFDVDKKANN